MDILTIGEGYTWMVKSNTPSTSNLPIIDKNHWRPSPQVPNNTQNTGTYQNDYREIVVNGY